MNPRLYARRSGHGDAIKVIVTGRQTGVVSTCKNEPNLNVETDRESFTFALLIMHDKYSFTRSKSQSFDSMDILIRRIIYELVRR